MKFFAQILATAFAVAAFVAPPAQGAFGLSDFEVAITDEDGNSVTQAGSHPFALTTSLGINFTGEGSRALVEGKVRDALFEQIVGLVGDATAVPMCSTVDFLTDTSLRHVCSVETVVGMQAPSVNSPGFFFRPGPIFNLSPPPGAAVRLGWKVEGVPIVVDVGIKRGPDYNAIATARGVNQTVALYRSIVELWGVPADPAHDLVRGWECNGNAKAAEGKRIERLTVVSPCPSNAPELPFLTLPRSCEGSAITRFEVRSWQEPDKWVTGSHEGPAFTGCEKLGFSPGVSAQTTTDSAETGTGLDFSIDFDDEGLKNPDGLAQSDMQKALVTLPEGVTVNPSVGEGLGVCAPADLDRETLSSAPGAGCPNASKIGTVHVESPLVREAIEGSVFLAPQDDPATPSPGAENPFDSLIAFYIVLKNPQLGILVKQPAKVEPHPATGQLLTTVEDIPQIPFSHFEFHFREGQRAPLISPPACGTYTTKAALTPRANPSQVRLVSSTFQITRGVGGGPCPPGGAPPFRPGFQAGALNNNAASYSPFHMRLLRSDGEQNMTRFSSVLPPGLLGKLAGVGKCSNLQILAAKAKTGRQEQASPSCPSGSRIGRTLAGAGVGSALTYVPGTLYLAGPYKKAPLSVVSITPALAGPFDAGAVVVRIGLDLNPLTAQVETIGAASDPIPHILKGIPLKLRDLEVAVDRPNFTLNPTNCDPSATKATIFGSYLDLFSAADDVPVFLSARHQIANCQTLAFKPSLRLKLKGGTKRGDHPALRAVLRARPGDANIGGATVTLPRSAFLDQAHIKTICTRVQYAADKCPAGSIYGHARAFTPLLDEPLEGPVYLRSSNNKLPDLVVSLQGIVDIDVSSRIDSHKGGIRNTFASVPDAPLSKFVLTMKGGKKGLIVNSKNLCARESRVKARFVGQNGKTRTLRPVLRPACTGTRKG
jgi:hypothetical protein